MSFPPPLFTPNVIRKFPKLLVNILPTMAAYARKLITVEGEVATYLLTNRCVRKSFLCGIDKDTGKNYEHRKKWLEDRIKYVIANCFFIDLLSYSILSNHFHNTVTTRPDLAKVASDEEIVNRWWKLFPRKIQGKYSSEPPEELKQQWLLDRDWIETRRSRLSNISWFMAQVSEPIARRANKEDGAPGRFWQGRFDSQILLDDKSILNASTYVDLNPLRAGMCKDLKSSDFTSIQKRIESLEKANEVPSDFLAPFKSAYHDLQRFSPSLCIDVKDYIAICTFKAAEFLGTSDADRRRIFEESISRLCMSEEDLDWKSLRKSNIAIGPRDKLVEFAKRRGVKNPYTKRQ
jgi:hypothetical protein